jgi:hypothetical protein
MGAPKGETSRAMWSLIKRRRKVVGGEGDRGQWVGREHSLSPEARAGVSPAGGFASPGMIVER